MQHRALIVFSYLILKFDTSPTLQILDTDPALIILSFTELHSTRASTDSVPKGDPYHNKDEMLVIGFN